MAPFPWAVSGTLTVEDVLEDELGVVAAAAGVGVVVAKGSGVGVVVVH